MASPKGLSSAEVAQRQQQGKTNRPPKSPTKTAGQIVRDNLCTYFNLVFVVLAVMLASVGSWLNMGFLGVVFCNTLIGIAQQLRAKKTIDELTLVSAHKVRCLRDDTWNLCLSEELVQDDVVEFGAGDQIVADAVVLEGSAQVNESLITGEARAVPKTVGGELRSGSFLMAGHCIARLTRVGEESYASKLTAAAQADGHKVAKGEMMRALDKLIKAIGLGLVPVGILLFWKQHWVLAVDLRSSVESVVAALIGMIPEGLYLLTSVALAVGMLRLARRRVLTQDMNCIETLARVDVLCVDKTGTITESTMEADDPVPLGAAPLDDLLRSYYAAEEPDNDTGRALKARFGKEGHLWPVTGQIPFNTAYKYSAKSFGEKGVYVVGAPDVLAGPRADEFRAQLAPLLAEGRRVLLLARYHEPLPDPPGALDPAKLEFLALLPLQNKIRANAPKTFAYFAGQGVDIKVISGDDPQAVSHVAAQAGIALAQVERVAVKAQAHEREHGGQLLPVVALHQKLMQHARRIAHKRQVQRGGPGRALRCEGGLPVVVQMFGAQRHARAHIKASQLGALALIVARIVVITERYAGAHTVPARGGDIAVGGVESFEQGRACRGQSAEVRIARFLQPVKPVN